MNIVFSILAMILVVFAIGSLGWGAIALLRRTENPFALATKWVLSVALVAFIFASARLGPYGVLVATMLGLVLGAIWSPHLANLLAGSLTSAFDGGNQEVDPAPFYSIAEAKRKQGNYQEAIAEIQSQLSRFPGDFAGLMLLAEIQADDLKDTAAAFATVDEILGSDRSSPGQVAYALNRAADWHLKYDQDPDLARTKLEQIVQRSPDTEQAQFALQRISHLATKEFLKERADLKPIAMGSFEQNVGLTGKIEGVAPPEEDPGEAVKKCVEHLNAYPNDNETRERLALIYANDFQRLDLAAEQLELLIGTPNQTQKQVVHWLNLLADFHVKIAADVEGARSALRRIIDLFPNSAAAENALSRSHFLNLELRQKTESPVIKLGSYDQNIGLR